MKSQSEEFPFGNGPSDAARPAAARGPAMTMSFDDEEPATSVAQGKVFSMEFDDEPAASVSAPVAATPVVSATPAPKPAPAMQKSSTSSGDWMSRLREMSDVPAWGVSLAAHLALIAALMCVKFVVETKSEGAIESTTEDVSQDSLNFDNAVMNHDQVGTTAEVTNFSLSTGTLSMGTENGTAGVIRQVTDEVASTSGSGTGPVVEVMPEPEGNSLQTAIVSGGQHGPSTESPGSTVGAIDRLAYEISGSLEKKKTLVVWMFDASLSLREQRSAIADRFENVYKQLDSLDVGADKALKTAVMYWGKNYKFITEDPVDDIRPLIEKVKKIPADESGVENIFTAVDAVTQKYRDQHTKGGRNILAIIITDERGDDYAKMETAIANARRYGLKFYVVGHAAPFGREHGHIFWKDDNYEGDVEIDQGPETLYPEALRLGFWGARGPSLERLSSGYGPWALTRLCRETGGLYLVSAEQHRAVQFDFNTMRNYQPDYRPVADIDRDIKKNKAKQVLIEAAMKTKAEGIPIPQTTFRADTDNVLREQVTEAQRPLAILDYRLKEMVATLNQGEKEREKITESRWKAAFDLAYGRALAMRIRAYGYNVMLAEMKGSIKPFQTKGSNQWELVPSKDMSKASADIKKMEKLSSAMLKRVMDEHAGTPWALLAERELSAPMGWEWKESNADYATMDRRMADAKRGPRFANEDEKKKAAKKKQMEQAAKKPTL
ncbi:MAG: VWA domain-containing protein [Planctomycetales bacterium]|nr:VWA domain-containing protein [Planctomycetales bacterium]